MSIKGFRSKAKSTDKVEGFTDKETDDRAEHVSVQELSGNRYGLDVVTNGFYEVATDAAEANSGFRRIESTGHSANKGDIIRFTSGLNTGVYSQALYVDTDNIIIADNIVVADTDAFSILRGVVQLLDSTGASISTSGPVQFVLDAANTQVNKDTGTPANNIPLPIELIDTTGVVDIRTLLGTANTNTGNIDGKLGTLGQKASAGSAPVVLSTEQEAILQSIADSNIIAPVDFLDAGLLDVSSTNIPVAGVTVVGSLAADCSEIEVIDDIGEFMTITDGSDVVLAYLPLGGGRVKVSITSGTALKLASLTGATLSGGNIAINFLG